MNAIEHPRRVSTDAATKLESAVLNDTSVMLNAHARSMAAQYHRDTMSPSIVSGTVCIIEFALFCLSGIAIGHVYSDSLPGLAWRHPAAVVVVSLLAIGLLGWSGCYRIPGLMRPLPTLRRVLLSWTATFAIAVLAGLMLNATGYFWRASFGVWFAVGMIILFGLRLIMARPIRHWARNGRIERRAVIVGGGEAAKRLIRKIEEQPYNSVRICGIFDDRKDGRSPPVVAGYPRLGTIAELIEFARIARIDLLIVSLPITAEQRVLQFLKKLWVLPVDIRLSAHSNALQFPPRSYSYIGAAPMLDIFDKPINDWNSVAKRAFDIVFSIVGIVLFSPIMLMTAIAIKLDSKGPILFRQKRHGFNNEVIEVYKFRSMYTDKSDPTARNTVTRNDPRVTRVGRVIRKTSIDELPQFFNALFGSLSLVGPRPHAIAAQSHNLLYNEVVDGYFARHRVKPGVTGWAQINGWRGEMDTDEKIRRRTEYDLYYIENWSLPFDLKILLLTPIRLFNTENAY